MQILQIILIVVFSGVGLISLFWFTNFLSYTVLKNRILRSRKWDLNICCAETDGKGINADIIQRKVPNFMLIKDVYNLPFSDKQFDSVLCSHTLEHVEDPKRMYRELHRIGKKVVIVLPPLWDITAAFNFLEHKSLFFVMRTKFDKLPAFVKLPFARFIHKIIGQKIK